MFSFLTRKREAFTPLSEDHLWLLLAAVLLSQAALGWGFDGMALASRIGAALGAPAEAAAAIETGLLRLLQLALVLALLKWVCRRPVSDLGLTVGRLKRDVLTFAAAAVLLGAAVLLAQGIGLAFGTNLLRDLLLGKSGMSSLPPGWFTVSLIVACVVAPVAEELFFRGILYQLARRYAPAWLSILATAALFAFLHGGGSFPLNQFVGGLLFATLYEMRRTLISPILLHAAGNLALFTLDRWL